MLYYLAGIVTSMIVLYLYVGYKEVKHVIRATKAFNKAKELRSMEMKLYNIRKSYEDMKAAFKRLKVLNSSSCVCIKTKECLIAYEDGKLIYQNTELIDRINKKRRRF